MKRLLFALVFFSLSGPAFASEYRGLDVEWIFDPSVRPQPGQNYTIAVRLTATEPVTISNPEVVAPNGDQGVPAWVAINIGVPDPLVLAAGQYHQGTILLLCSDPEQPLHFRYEVNGQARRSDAVLLEPRAGFLHRDGPIADKHSASGSNRIRPEDMHPHPTHEALGNEETPPAGTSTAVGKAQGVALGRLLYARGWTGNKVGAEGVVAYLYHSRLGPDVLLGADTVDGYGDWEITYDYGASSHLNLWVCFVAENSGVKVRTPFGVPEQGIYHWDTPVEWNVPGGTTDFGEYKIVGSQDRNAAHMLRTLTRARQMFANVNWAPPKVSIFYPDSDWPHYNGNDIIKIPSDMKWAFDDEMFVHEYGHHWMNYFGSTGDSDGYCNEGDRCEEADGTCRHCLWCMETSSIAWSEGVPTYFADRYYRWSPLQSGDFGSIPIVEVDYEKVQWCSVEGGGNDDYDPAHLTEGAVVTLLRDLEDGGSDDFDEDPRGYDANIEGLKIGKDTSDYNFGTILTMIHDSEAESPMQFILALAGEFPTHRKNLWRTAYNSGFNIDFLGGPGAVVSLFTTSHNTIEESPDGTIDFQWYPADDTYSPESRFYSVWIGPTPQMPDMIADMYAPDEGNILRTLTTDELGPGTYYFSVRAADWVGNWSAQYASIGPFTIRDPENPDLAAVADPLWAFSMVPSNTTLPETPPINAPLFLSPGNVYAHMQVKNTGDLATAGNLVVRATLDGKLLGDRSITPGTPLGADQWRSWYNLGPLTTFAGRHTLSQRADALEDLREWNEADNWFIKQWIWSGIPYRDNSDLVRPAPPLPYAGWKNTPLLGHPNCWGLDLDLPSDGFLGVAIRALSNEDDYDLRIHNNATSPQSGYLTHEVMAWSFEPKGSIDAVFFGAENIATQPWDVGILNSSNFFLARGESDVEVDIRFSQELTVGVPHPDELAADASMGLFHFGATSSPPSGRGITYAVTLTTNPATGDMHLSLLDDGTDFVGLRDALSTAKTNASGVARLYVTGTIFSESFGAVVHRDPPADGLSNGIDDYTIEVSLAQPDYLPGADAGWAGPVLPYSSPQGNDVTVPEPTTLTGDTNQYVSLSLENATSQDAPTVVHRLFIDGVLRSDVIQLPEPGPGFSTAIDMPLGNVPGGRHTISSFVDPADLVAEEDELNNGFADQWVFLPTTLSVGGTTTRPAPPAPSGGLEYLVGPTLHLNCDGLRMPVPLPSRDDGYWQAMAVVPSVGTDVDLRLHEAATGARDGFGDAKAHSSSGGDQTEFVATNFRVGSLRAMDVGIVGASGAGNVSAHVARSTYLAAAPLGEYGDFQLAPGHIVALHEVELSQGIVDIELLHVAGAVDWGISVLRAGDEYHGRSGGRWAFEEWIAPIATNELVQVEVPQSGFYCVAVWKANHASLNETGVYRLDFGATTPTAIPTLPDNSRIVAVRPNPFNPMTTIEFALQTDGPVRLEIYDVSGARVRSLLDGALAAGEHSRRWDGRDDRGTVLASGVYYAQLRHADGVDRRKLLLLK